MNLLTILLWLIALGTAGWILWGFIAYIEGHLDFRRRMRAHVAGRGFTYYAPYYYGKRWWRVLLQPLWKILAGAAAVLVALIVCWILVTSLGTYHHVGTRTYALSSLKTGAEQESSYTAGIFVAVGYSGENRVISYVRDSGDGGFVVKQVDADDAVIYEREGTPSIEVHTWEKTLDWVAGDDPADTKETFTFVVPEGSVVNTFEVAP